MAPEVSLWRARDLERSINCGWMVTYSSADILTSNNAADPPGPYDVKLGVTISGDKLSATPLAAAASVSYFVRITPDGSIPVEVIRALLQKLDLTSCEIFEGSLCGSQPALLFSPSQRATAGPVPPAWR